MLQFLQKYHIPVLIVGTLVLLLSYLQLLQLSEASPRLHTDPLTQEDYDALTKRLTLITERHNPREAFSLLRRHMKENAAVSASCHALAHGMGHAAYMKYQDFGNAMNNAEQLCNSGYTHGVIEAYFADIQDFRFELLTLCDNYTPGTFTRWQCDHGVGHGVMFATNNDLPASILLCNTLPREDARSRCINGVFMENVMADQKNHRSTYVRSDNLKYPCNDQSESSKPHCYGYVPTNYLAHHPGMYEEALAFCTEVESAYRMACVQGVGSRVIVEQIDRPDEVIQLCATSGEYADSCLTGMIHEYINHYAGISEAGRLCRKFPSDKQSLCIDVVRQKSVLFLD